MTTSANLSDLSTKPPDYFSQTRTEMLEVIPLQARRVLEIGCGNGSFGERLKTERNVEVWGIERDRTAVAMARAKLDRVIEGDVLEELTRLADERFDCVICNDVLEHLVDPYSVLTAIKSLLNPTGLVVCSIPNIRYFRNFFAFVVKGDWHYEESGIMDKTHLRFFTRKSILDTFIALGYSIEQLDGINATTSWRVKLLNFATLGFFDDTRYLQYRCVAKPRKALG